ncbi:MAG TPA: sugar ABC transporter substrate-binding protein [Polyangiaceae bacterium]|nr:sugar ABC transporter substrate-binding protein [Polyangiaceae bacterium]
MATAILLSTACAERRRSFAGAGGERVIAFVGWGAPEERGVMADVVALFEQSNPGLRVTYTQVPGTGYDYLNKLRLMIVAGNAPDVFYVPDGAFGELVRTGALLDLDERIAASGVVDLDAMWPSAVDRYRWDGRRLHQGHLYALPKDMGPTAMFYDADRFRERGVPLPDPVVPMTWSEARAMWAALSDRAGPVRRYGLTGYPFDVAVWAAGGEVLTSDRRSWAMQNPVAEGAVQWCADLALSDGVAPLPSRVEGGGGRELFEARLAATHIDGRWMVPRFRKLGFDWDVAPIPMADRDRPPVVWSGSVGFAVAASTPYPDEAIALVAWLAGPEGQAPLTRTGLQLPNQRALAKTDLFLQPGQRPVHADVFVRAAKNSRPSAITETPNSFWFDVLSIFLDEVWRGRRTAASLFPELAPRIDAALRENNPEL